MVVNLEYIDLKIRFPVFLFEGLMLPGGGGAKNGYGKCWWGGVNKLWSGVGICGKICIDVDGSLWVVIDRESNKFNDSFVIDDEIQEGFVISDEMVGIDLSGIIAWWSIGISDGLDMFNIFSEGSSDLSLEICRHNSFRISCLLKLSSWTLFVVGDEIGLGSS